MPGEVLARISNTCSEIRIDSVTRRRREPVNVIVNFTQQQSKHFVLFRVRVIACARTQGQKLIDGCGRGTVRRYPSVLADKFPERLHVGMGPRRGIAGVGRSMRCVRCMHSAQRRVKSRASAFAFPAPCSSAGLFFLPPGRCPRAGRFIAIVLARVPDRARGPSRPRSRARVPVCGHRAVASVRVRRRLFPVCGRSARSARIFPFALL